MQLKEEHITINKSNWLDKVSNLKNIAYELNIGLDSIVFVDDSSFEVNLVRQKLPQVKVLQVPKRLFDYASKAEANNISVIIAGAGGSAHLPGMVAAITTIPVIGVPIESSKLKGIDSLLSIVQMPKGIPVGTLAIGEDGAINAGLLAASIIANHDHKVKKNLSFQYFFFLNQSI